MDNKNFLLRIPVDEIVSNLNLKIKRLKEVDVDNHKYEIQFLEYLQTNFMFLGDFRNQIYGLIPYYQKKIVSNWNHVSDKNFETTGQVNSK